MLEIVVYERDRFGNKTNKKRSFVSEENDGAKINAFWWTFGGGKKKKGKKGKNSGTDNKVAEKKAENKTNDGQ